MVSLLGERYGTLTKQPENSSYSVAVANRKLRFAIASMEGKVESSIWKRRLQTALIIKDDLLTNGYLWQAQRIDNWIHRLQGRELLKDEARIQASCSSPELTSKERAKEASY